MQANRSSSQEIRPSRGPVLEQVKQIVAQHVEAEPETIRETDALEADLGCDSLDVIEISMELEEEFDISVPDEIMEDIRTVSDVVDGVLQLLGES